MNYTIINSETRAKLLSSISECQNENFRFGAGFTDLTLELKKNSDDVHTVINLGFLRDKAFTSIEILENAVRIGAMGTAFEISSAQFIKEHYPVLHQAAFGLGSYQIRQVATIGGNICTASPSGDMANALVALKARCEILNADGRIRIIPIENFFLDVRKTDLKKNEVLQSILLEKNTGEKLYSGYIKVGTRRSMECSVVSLAYHIVSDNSETIVKAGISIGASAPTIKFAASASEYLLNRKLSSISSDEASHFAEKVMEYASPISDIRATAWYRKEALFNICKSIFDTFDKLKTCSAL